MEKFTKKVETGHAIVPKSKGNKKKLISFVGDSKKIEQISVHLNEEGIDFLILELNELKKALKNDICEHIHLTANEFEDGVLTKSKLENHPDEKSVVESVKIYAWTLEWQNKHKLL